MRVVAILFLWIGLALPVYLFWPLAVVPIYYTIKIIAGAYDVELIEVEEDESWRYVPPVDSPRNI